MNLIAVNRIIKDEADGVTVVTKRTLVYPMWGCSANCVTREQVQALLDGKCWYFDDGEYAHIIYLKEGES